MVSKQLLTSFYKESLALLTDLYELTMAYGYWKLGMVDRQAVFHLNFRKPPFKGPFALAAGLDTVLDFLEHFHYSASDLAYLEQLTADGSEPLFEKRFLDYLSTLVLQCDIDAVVEGTPVFPYESLLRVQGPLLQAQILESPLLNIINFQSLIATKSARICWAARPDPVVEFGIRRAQGIDGALSASRAAYIGGCESTSHVLAGKVFGIPVKGTLAHSWVMAFEDEEFSFEAFADVMPRNCIFLIDTYNSLEGTKKAIAVAKKMRAKGIDMIGVRLDSGDLAALSIEIRKLLDHAGFPKAKIMASNELDEYLITELKRQGTKVNVWGVGTNLVTGKEQPALDGVYKLTALQDDNGKWEYKIKISEQIAKVTNPGILQIRRYRDEKGYCFDMLYDVHDTFSSECIAVDPLDPSRIRKAKSTMAHQDLLIPVMRKGKRVYSTPSLSEIRAHAAAELDRFPVTMRRFHNPEPYFVGMEQRLNDKKLQLIKNLRSSF
jgi:nicotinate phosphoribosyltransferase